MWICAQVKPITDIYQHNKIYLKQQLDIYLLNYVIYSFLTPTFTFDYANAST